MFKAVFESVKLEDTSSKIKMNLFFFHLRHWRFFFLSFTERCELSATVARNVCGDFRKAHWCAVTGASEVSSFTLTHLEDTRVYIMCKCRLLCNTPLAPGLSLPPPHTLFVCVPGWRRAALRCPYSPERSWYFSATSYGTAHCTYLTRPSTTAAPHIPCSSSSSSSLCAGEAQTAVCTPSSQSITCHTVEYCYYSPSTVLSLQHWVAQCF